MNALNTSVARPATVDARRVRIGGAIRVAPGPLATADVGRIKIGGAIRRA